MNVVISANTNSRELSDRIFSETALLVLA